MIENISEKDIIELNKQFENSPPQEIVKWAVQSFSNQLSLACSLSGEDTTLLYILDEEIAKEKLKENTPNAFVLDTGRLHEKSYELLDVCRNRYAVPIDIYFPQYQAVEKLVKEKGLYSFYNSLENRKECCFIRKIEPLHRALKNKKAWITGLRKEQSETRSNFSIIELDTIPSTSNSILKINPLLNWSWEMILDFSKKNKLPIHSLHKEAYPSIGCEPCTRAVKEGESLRSGRWWWEDASTKECGLHIKN